MSEDHVTFGRVNIFGEQIIVYGLQDDNYFKHVTEDEFPDIDIITLASLITPQDGVCVDVGANIGYESMAFSILAPKGEVFAFEPVPSNVALIKKNLKVNSIKNVRVNQVGLSDEAKSYTIIFNNENRGGATLIDDSQQDLAAIHDNHNIVEVKKLDAIYKELKIRKCDLLKVDIEGHEPNFLRGASSFIKKFKPPLIIEANHWCLNGLNRVAMPEFLDQVENIYPCVAAFDRHEWIDVKANRHSFMHENLVNNRFQNLYCDFDRARWTKTMTLHMWGWPKLRDLNNMYGQAIELLTNENNSLIEEIRLLKTAKKPKRDVTTRIAKRLRSI